MRTYIYMKSPTMAPRAPPTDAAVALCYAREKTWSIAHGPNVVDIPQTNLRSACWHLWPSCGYNPRCALSKSFRGVKANIVPWPEYLLGPPPPPKKNGPKERARRADERRQWLGQAQETVSAPPSDCHGVHMPCLDLPRLA